MAQPQRRSSRSIWRRAILSPCERSDFGTVGVFDVDWLGAPKFTDMLDAFAASPGAIAGVRFFGAFTAGQLDLSTPETSGAVWTDPDGPIDFSATFAALEKLTTRGLTPFIALGFFPPAISPSPIEPPGKLGSLAAAGAVRF